MRPLWPSLLTLLLPACTPERECTPTPLRSDHSLHVGTARAASVWSIGRLGGDTARVDLTLASEDATALVLEPEGACAQVGCTARYWQALRDAEPGDVTQNGARVLGRWGPGAAAITLTERPEGSLVYVRLGDALAPATLGLESVRYPTTCASRIRPTLHSVPPPHAVCGDGWIEGSEQCDDGGDVAGDGCHHGRTGAPASRPTCAVEPPRCARAPGEAERWRCTGEPSRCEAVFCQTGACPETEAALTSTRALLIGRGRPGQAVQAAVTIAPTGARCGASTDLTARSACEVTGPCAALQAEGGLVDWDGCPDEVADGICVLGNATDARHASARFALPETGVIWPDQPGAPMTAFAAGLDGARFEARPEPGAPRGGVSVVALSADGQRRWTVGLSSPVHTMVADDQGGLWVAMRARGAWQVGGRDGETGVDGAATAALLVARISPEGAAHRPIQIGGERAFEPEGVFLAPLPTDGAARVALLTDEPAGPVVLREVRGDGARGWSHTLGDARAKAGGLVPTGAGVAAALVATAADAWSGAEGAAAGVWAFDPAGAARWQSTWPVVEATRPTLAWDAQRDEVIYAGSAPGGWSLRRLDAAGARVAAHPISADGCTTWRGVAPASDGAWVLAGHCELPGRLRVLRLDAEGAAAWIEHLGGVEHAQSIPAGWAVEGDALRLYGTFGDTEREPQASVTLRP